MGGGVHRHITINAAMGEKSNVVAQNKLLNQTKTKKVQASNLSQNNLKQHTRLSWWSWTFHKKTFRCREVNQRADLIVCCCLKPYLSGSASVMSIRGREAIGRLVGLVAATSGSSSGDRGLLRSFSFSPCRHDSGGSCKLPENRRWTLHSSTPRVLPMQACSTGGSSASC